MGNRDGLIIKKMQSEIHIITEIVDGISFNAFVSDEKTKRAVCMTLINIGELVKNLSNEFREKHCHIKWRDIAGLRDTTAHRYQTLRIEDIWETIMHDIPILYMQIESIDSEK